ncbi:MAG: hypothetical protein KGD59_03930 [Candidatus Heimdallarchaeota archaeon]|nr:hypothetical protein [Candidatus Heimdallarchaeota archaeon]MBY8993674.1 hypothetical protein [Candidatus Heimdallarchaeota archaeon]
MTLYVSFLLHIYQPPTQTPTILKQVIKESYQPLFEVLTNNPNTKITLNINGSLIELLDLYDENTLLDTIRSLVINKQIDLIGSSCYHAILPLIPQEEITRQIKLNEEIFHKFLGKGIYNPKGFWLPEMAYEFGVIEPLIAENFEWTVISSVATPDEELPDDYIPFLKPNFKIYFRNDLLSNLISFKNPTVEEFYQELKGLKNPKKDDYYVILAMDGETYGHHIKGLIEDFFEPLMSKINQDPNVKLIMIAEIPKYFSQEKKVNPLPSTWSTTAEDLQQGVPFPLWSNPNNRIHNLQLTVMNHALFLVGKAQRYMNNTHNQPEEFVIRYKNARTWLDKGLHSCQLWWASGRPWYSSEMILKGLNQLILASSEALKVVLKNCTDNNEIENVKRIFNEIFEAQKEIYLSV